MPSEVGKTILNHKVIGTDADLGHLREKIEHVVVGIGHMPGNMKRLISIDMLSKLKYRFPVIISKYATVSTYAHIEEGSTIGHKAVINAGANIGAHTIINTMALIEHDVTIGKHCHISTGALVNGGVAIGNNSFVGSGAMIREGLVLPQNAIISAGKRVMGWPLL